MKKIFLLCIGLIALLQPILAETISEEDKQLRDSIFQVFHTSEKNDSSRVRFMRIMFQKNIGKEWATEMLDSALALAVKSKYGRGEIGVYYDNYRQSKYLKNMEAMRKNLANLKKASEKHQSYEWYFVAWADILTFSDDLGDTENVIIEARRMAEEAQRVKCLRGMAMARIAEAEALSTIGQYDEALQRFSEALEVGGLSKVDRANLFSSIAGIYEEKGAYDKALVNLQMEAAEMRALLKNPKASKAAYDDNMLNLELHFCHLYSKMNDKENLYKHLKDGEKYYKPNSMFTLQYNYLRQWAKYYHLTKEWDKCFDNYDAAITLIGDLQPFYRLSVRCSKSEALRDAGRSEEAALTFRQSVSELDSLNGDVLKRHEEIHRANYGIRLSLLNRETAEMRYNLLKAIGISILALMILGLLVRAFFVRRLLRRSKRETEATLNEVKAADKMKEVFLGNITHEIRTPLNAVVGFSELLSTEQDLTQEEKQQYATLIKHNAEWLTKLVFDILDLSRLESGMMKFDVQTCDAVQLCRDAQMMVEMQDANSVHIDFNTELDALPIQADSGRFMKLLGSVLSATRKNHGLSLVQFQLAIDGVQLKITVSGSPLLEHMADEEDESLPNRIQHDINRIYLSIFKGSYKIEVAEGKQLIIITYPI